MRLTTQTFHHLCPNFQDGFQHGNHIGLLMGSFNPAHLGHIHISQMAKKHLHLDRVWWFITPHNPFKQKQDLANLDDRVALAKDMVARHANIPIDIATPERMLHRQYSAQTIFYLQRAFPNKRFTLLMGSDNLCQLPTWHRADKIIGKIPIAIIRRNPYHYKSLLQFRNQLKGMDKRYRHSNIANNHLIYIDGAVNSESSTAIRRKLS